VRICEPHNLYLREIDAYVDSCVCVCGGGGVGIGYIYTENVPVPPPPSTACLCTAKVMIENFANVTVKPTIRYWKCFTIPVYGTSFRHPCYSWFMEYYDLCNCGSAGPEYQAHCWVRATMVHVCLAHNNCLKPSCIYICRAASTVALHYGITIQSCLYVCVPLIIYETSSSFLWNSVGRPCRWRWPRHHTYISVVSTSPKPRTSKLLRWMQNLHQ
jgi:hypothetical protein